MPHSDRLFVIDGGWTQISRFKNEMCIPAKLLGCTFLRAVRTADRDMTEGVMATSKCLRVQVQTQM